MFFNIFYYLYEVLHCGKLVLWFIFTPYIYIYPCQLVIGLIEYTVKG